MVTVDRRDHARVGDTHAAEGSKWRWGPVRTNLLTTGGLFNRESESSRGCPRGPVVNVYVQDRDPVSPFRNRERARGGGIAGTL